MSMGIISMYIAWEHPLVRLTLGEDFDCAASGSPGLV